MILFVDKDTTLFRSSSIRYRGWLYGNPINCKVVVNHTVELTEEEKEQARQDAIERLRQEEMAKLRKPIQPKKATEKKTQDVQPSLFDF
ncbi:Cas9 inhibitor AcrIIA9 family protein [uncultured Duncaniella sp.]|uniref:PcfK-like family protein n=1 Tax=uncultured Duncaniella sp. TaxID=2768039 RepID=UPI0025B67954|nr:Cas9 inhibitor AcrIIA9 family protein [uncultured Duncaniella sp.]